ncbi:MAG: hypothetical protein GX592_08325 [Clostridiales bacterium]|nr:hypothetical protein [Clostridiales bacterium]
MQTQKRVKSRVNARAVLPMGAALIALALIILVCIFAARAANIQNEYAELQKSVDGALYSNLRMFIRSYEPVSLAGADIEGAILPTMRDYFSKAVALDGVISEAYGTDYTVLDEGTKAAVAAAFGAFDEAFRQGQSTAPAISSMSSCVQALEQTLLRRFDDDLRLLRR